LLTRSRYQEGCQGTSYGRAAMVCLQRISIRGEMADIDDGFGLLAAATTAGQAWGAVEKTGGSYKLSVNR